MRLPVLCLLCCIGLAAGQYNRPSYPATTPVPILKQINKHNEDGSYSYGYEAADGSYKIESKYPTGEVYGKYGFVDDTGKIREVEYGASRRGFEPAGSGINVPPPTLTGNSIAPTPNHPEDDGQYREDPSIYYTDPRYTNGERYEPAPKHRQQAYNHQQPAAYAPPPPRQPTPSVYRPQQYEAEYRPQYRSQYQPQYQGQAAQPRPSYPAANQLQTSPLGPTSSSNIAVNSGLASYTVNYRR